MYHLFSSVPSSLHSPACFYFKITIYFVLVSQRSPTSTPYLSSTHTNTHTLSLSLSLSLSLCKNTQEKRSAKHACTHTHTLSLSLSLSRQNSHTVFFLFFGQFCDIAKLVMIPQEDLAKFGYKLKYKTNILKIYVSSINIFEYFWLPT